MAAEDGVWINPVLPKVSGIPEGHARRRDVSDVIQVRIVADVKVAGTAAITALEALWLHVHPVIRAFRTLSCWQLAFLDGHFVGVHRNLDKNADIAVCGCRHAVANQRSTAANRRSFANFIWSGVVNSLASRVSAVHAKSGDLQMVFVPFPFDQKGLVYLRSGIDVGVGFVGQSVGVGIGAVKVACVIVQ